MIEENEVTEPKVRQRHDYIDNQMFYRALVERRLQVNAALLEQAKEDEYELAYRQKLIDDSFNAPEDAPVEIHKKYFNMYKVARKSDTFPELILPQVSNYLGDCFIKLSENFSKIQSATHSYYRYSFRDEMVADAIINCLRYIDSFDVYRSKNPFGFFTTCIHHSFVMRIHKERKELATKQRIIKTFDFDKVSLQGHDDKEFINEYIDQLKSYNTGVDYADYYDKKQEKINKSNSTNPKKHKLTLLDFMDADDEEVIIEELL